MIKKNYIYVIIGIFIFSVIIYYGYVKWSYRKILNSAKNKHQNTTEEVFNLKLEEERLKQQKEDLKNQLYEEPDREKLIEFLNNIKAKK